MPNQSKGNIETAALANQFNINLELLDDKQYTISH